MMDPLASSRLLLCRCIYAPHSAEHLYRNPRTEVQRLLDKYHKEHYKVYNFANEAGRNYPDQLFQGRVERYVRAVFSTSDCQRDESSRIRKSSKANGTLFRARRQ